MRNRVKIALGAGALALGGGVLLAGVTFAQGFHHHGMGIGMGMMSVHREMLADIDANKDGALSQDEINASIAARMNEFDANRDNQLSLSEFQALWAEITKPISVRTFQFLDPNGDAEVSKQELDDRFGTIVARFDRNDDGMLSPADRSSRYFGWRHGRGHHGYGRDDDSDGGSEE